VIAVEVAPPHHVGGDLEHLDAARERDARGTQVVHTSPASRQPEVQGEHLGGLEHGDARTFGRGALGDAETRQVATDHHDVVADRATVEQPHGQLVDHAHVRQGSTGQRGASPLRTGRDDHRVGVFRDDGVGVDALTEPNVHTAQLQLMLEPAHQLGIGLRRRRRVRPPSAQARCCVDEGHTVTAQRSHARALHAPRTGTHHEHRTR
jgi:hypothetical protein